MKNYIMSTRQDKPLDIKAMTIDQIAGILSKSSKRNIPIEYVQKVVDDAGIVKPDGTVNLIEYIAYLAREVRYAR